jgi:hypothetical protein
MDMTLSFEGKLKYLRVIWRQLDWLVGELGIEMFKIAFRRHKRFVRRHDLLCIQMIPIDSFEEWMTLDVDEPSLRMTAETILRHL